MPRRVEKRIQELERKSRHRAPTPHEETRKAAMEYLRRMAEKVPELCSRDPNVRWGAEQRLQAGLLLAGLQRGMVQEDVLLCTAHGNPYLRAYLETHPEVLEGFSKKGAPG